MKKLVLIISLFIVLSCKGQIPGIGHYQIPGIVQNDGGECWCDISDGVVDFTLNLVDADDSGLYDVFFKL